MGQYPSKVYLNGEIVDHQNARVSVFDRGFLFGDGIYEVMVQLDGSFFYEQAHLQRLSDCLQKISIAFNVNTLPARIQDLLQASGLQEKDCLLYIQVTRGTAPRKHAFPTNVPPTVMMHALPHVLPDINTNCTSVITMPDFRWSRCDIKMTSLLGNVMANDAAIKQGAFEALMVRDGEITEASHCNVFFVRDSIVHTHPADEHILNGITRQIVIKLCADLGLEVREEAVRQTDIAHMDEAFLTGTTTQIASVRQIDTHVFYSDGNAGKVTRRLQEAFFELKKGMKKVLQD